MKSKITIFITLTILFLLSCNQPDTNNLNHPISQNEEHKDPEIRDNYYPDNKVSAIPPKLANLADGTKIDLRNSVYLWIRTVENFDHRIPNYAYSRFSSIKQQPVFFIPYALFNLGSNFDPMILATSREDMKKCIDSGMKRDVAYQICWLNTFRNKILYKIYASPSLQLITYNWIMPEWKKSFNQMDDDKKRLISEILNHVIIYTENYDHLKELKFYNKCKNGKEYLFSSVFEEIDGEIELTNPYRKAETWVFRRVYHNHMTASEINTWLVKIKNDLNL